MNLHEAYAILEKVSTTDISINDIENDIKFLLDRYQECYNRRNFTLEDVANCTQKTVNQLNLKIGKLRRGVIWEKFRLLFNRMVAYFMKNIKAEINQPAGKYVYVYLQDYSDEDFSQVKVKNGQSNEKVGAVLKSLEKQLKKENAILLAFKQLD